MPQKPFEYSRQINALKVLMILFVIFIHENPTHATHGILALWWNRIVTAAVPVFFVISGFFFFRNIDAFDLNTYKKQLGKRFRSLFIPYMLWNLMPICIYAAGNLYSIIFKGKSFEALSEFICGLWKEGLWHMWWDKTGGTMPFDSPLWYVRDLIILCLLSPLGYHIIRKAGLIFISAVAIVYISGIWQGYTGLSLTGILFFSIGAEFALSGRNLSNIHPKTRIAFYGLSLLLFLSVSVFNLSCLHPSFILISCCAWILLFCQMGGVKFARYSETVFFILAIHNIFVLANVGKMLEKLHIAPTLAYWIAPFITLIACVILYYCIKAVAPKAMKVLCGGR